MLTVLFRKADGGSLENLIGPSEWSGAEASLFRVLRPIYCNTIVALLTLFNPELQRGNNLITLLKLIFIIIMFVLVKTHL